MYDTELKELIEFNENIAAVWVDIDGSWHTWPKDGCTEVSRDEILSDKTKKSK